MDWKRSLAGFASAGCVQSWNFTMTCSWQLRQLFFFKDEGRCQSPFVHKCHWDFEILQLSSSILKHFHGFFKQFTSIPSNSGIVSTVSKSISTSVSTGRQGDPLEAGTTHGSRSRFGDSPGAGRVSQDDQWQDPEESVEDLWRQSLGIF